MTTYDFVHVAFLAYGGEIKGKTKVQKSVYFLGIMTGVLGELGYRPHFYGPFSPEVAEAISRLRALGFLDQSVASGGGFDQRGFEVARYDFHLTPEGERAAKTKAQTNPELWRELMNAVNTLKNAGDPDYVKLSIAAKTHFMLGERKESSSFADLATLASKFGWVVRPEEARGAAEFLKQLGLVHVSGES